MWPVVAGIVAIAGAIWLMSKPSKASTNEGGTTGGATGGIGAGTGGKTTPKPNTGGATGGATGGGLSGAIGAISEKLKDPDTQKEIGGIFAPILSGEVSAVPTPGRWYEIQHGDIGSAIASKAYGPTKPTLVWRETVVKHAANAAAPLSGGGNIDGYRWFSGKWNGKGSVYGSGHRYATIYIPVK